MDITMLLERKDARTAGIYYLLHILFLLYGVVFVSVKLGISGTEGMAGKISANEFLFRSGIICRLFCMVPTMFLAFPLYRMFAKINKQQARLMIAILLLSIPFQFIAEVFNLTAIPIANGELLKSLGPLQKKEVILLLLSLYNNMVSVGQVFWGLWLFPFGLLVYRSGFIPWRIGILLILGGFGYLADYLAFLLSPSWRSVTVLALLFGLLSEMIIMAWLLMAGTKKTPAN